MKIVLRLAPAFLRRFDEYLRVKYPWFWVTRFHGTLYMGLIIIPIIVLIACIVPLNHGSDFGVFENTSFINLLFFLVIGWIIFLFRQLSLYNLDKSHGKQGVYNEFLILLTYFVTFLLPISLPAIATTIIESRLGSSLMMGGLSWKVAIIMSFYLAVIFNIFKQVNTKRFFLNFAVCGGLLFVLGNLSVIFASENVFIHGIMYIFLGVLIFVLTSYKSPRYNGILHQGVIFLNTLFPIVGIIILLYMFQVFGVLGESFGSIFKNSAPNAGVVDEFGGKSFLESIFNNIWSIVFWGGLLLHLFLWNTLFKKAYLRLWNLPRSK